MENSVGSQNAGGGLEDRLRQLILNGPDTGGPPSSPSRPPGFHNEPEHPAIGGTGRETSAPLSPQPREGRKRPNQAQRRQMSSQLSISIDPRQTAPTPPKTYTRDHPTTHSSPPHAQHRQYASMRSEETYVGAGRNYNSGPTGYGRGSHHQSGYRGRGNWSQGPRNTQPHRQQDWRQSQPNQPGQFFRGVNVVAADDFKSRGPRNPKSDLYNPSGHRQYVVKPEELASQVALLDQLSSSVLAGAEIATEGIAEKENFRAHIEMICRAVISDYEINVSGVSWFQPETVQLKCFGSLASGFATKAADMDLGLLSPLSAISPELPNSPIPRLVEKALLDAGFGGRLLSRTRVPIIKLCERPPQQLLQDLRDERMKWETGLVDDEHDPNDEEGAFDDLDAPEEAVLDNDQTGPKVGDKENSPKKRTHEERLTSLRQPENQSLKTYYASAKRLLRRLNGRDLTNSNSNDFEEADYKLLDDVSVAFVRGLHDSTTSTRIQESLSFSGVDQPLAPKRRTLMGVFTMVQGEKLVHLYEGHNIPADTGRFDHAAAKAIQHWRDLMDGSLLGMDPLVFNKDLHMAAERLRQIPSIQLLDLRQDQFESPSEYHSRALKILLDLGGADDPFNNADLLQFVTHHYIQGIREKAILKAVEEFAQQSPAANLNTIARKHKSLHLGAQYEKAVEKDLYDEQDLPTIRAYISLLSGDFSTISSEGNGSGPLVNEPFLPVPLALITEIKQLQDPSRLVPNQPKDRYHDRLEFPKAGVGVQCDINFSAHLALHNTALLRCYSYTDPRVRPLVLFVKHWAKVRGINTPYRGTLSSYGYVLMVLHYLVNVVQPFVCPNLQQLAPPDPSLPPEALEDITTCKGHNIRFWRDEDEIQRLAHDGVLNQNQQGLGSLLRGFFEYYAQNNMMSTVPVRGFDWGRDVLSLRTHGGLLSKQEKGWTGAKTVLEAQMGAPPTPTNPNTPGLPQSPPSAGAIQQATTQPMSPEADTKPTTQVSKMAELKEVRHRYLFAIEDPFELDHNVARTVTHNGIVGIRDEFRRAWRLIRSSGKPGQPQENLLEDVNVRNEEIEKQQFLALLDEIHGHVAL